MLDPISMALLASKLGLTAGATAGMAAPTMAAAAPAATGGSLLSAYAAAPMSPELTQLINMPASPASFAAPTAAEAPGLMDKLQGFLKVDQPNMELLKNQLTQQQQQQPLTPMQLAQKQMAQIPQIDLMSLLSQLGGR